MHHHLHRLGFGKLALIEAGATERPIRARLGRPPFDVAQGGELVEPRCARRGPANDVPQVGEEGFRRGLSQEASQREAFKAGPKDFPTVGIL